MLILNKKDKVLHVSCCKMVVLQKDSHTMYAVVGTSIVFKR